MVLAFLLIFVFVVGASVGSFLNVAIARLPLEKSLLWPNSRCGACLQSIRWYDNLPLVSYLLLRGRCRTCGQPYSIVYFLVELGVALGFVALFLLEVVVNVHRWPMPAYAAVLGRFPWETWLGFLWHAVLFSFLVVASVCDLKSREIPLQLTLTGTLIGLIGATLMPWPWPNAIGVVLPTPVPTPGDEFLHPLTKVNQGTYAWPFWGPLPTWTGEGTMLTGLLTGVVGALVGTFLLRMVGFLFSAGLGKDALGMGDADLMMMAGSFVGWQIVVVAFFLSAIPALFFGILQLIVNKDNSMPFGPSLSFSVMATMLAWQPLGEVTRTFLFNDVLLIIAVVLCASMLFGSAFLIRAVRGKEEPT